MAEERQWWIFTFGYGQEHEGHFVKFFGTYGEARSKMIEKYGLRWAFQYCEEDWERWRKQGWWPMETELEAE